MAEPNLPGMGLLYFGMTGKEDEAHATPPPGSKRRRLRGACAECRQRKIRCDRAKQASGICSNCVAFNCPCTDPRADYLPEKRTQSNATSSKTAALLRSYEDKTAAEHVESIVVQSTAYIDARDLRGILLEVAKYSRALEDELKACRARLHAPSTQAPRASSQSRGTDGSGSSSPRNSDLPAAGAALVKAEDDALIEDFQNMQLIHGPRSRYFGESSGQHLFRTAKVFKQQHDGEPVAQSEQPSAPVGRLHFWKSPWEIIPKSRPPTYTFPPQDLLENLTDLYFRHWNILLPLLHRPTFERNVASGLHLLDPSFGAVLLGVCALGARCSDDPRVIRPGTDTKLSAGWEWMDQIRFPEKPEFYFTLSLHGLQQLMASPRPRLPSSRFPSSTLMHILQLSTLYLQGSSSACQCWTLGGIAIRNLQDVGRHRQRRYPSAKAELTIEDELYRRVFWLFIVGDIYMSALLGRPRATTEDDYDVAYPTECDDEYWERADPAQRFVQPEGKPSQISYFVVHLKLLEILGRAQKTIYSLRRHKRTSEWSQEKVDQLNSELNTWLDSIPDHLRWDPHREKSTFATQSACLYASYYHVQIQIHRIFIPSPSNDRPLSSSFPSLAICANAARACSHVMEVQARNGVFFMHPQGLSSLLDSALVLMIADIQRCMSCIKAYEQRLQIAGRFSDLLTSIGSRVILNPPATPIQLKRGRERESESVAAGAQQALSQSHRAPSTSQYARKATSDPVLSSSGVLTGSDFGLGLLQLPAVNLDMYTMPMSTEQLGSSVGLLYQDYDWANPPGAPALSHTAMADAGLLFSFADAGVLTAMSQPGQQQGDAVFQNFYPQQ
ncbi:Zn(2)-C6 fungal-type domain-containing protein [Mycena kentingensis (nom. inval.)]|nr:Zn(2)-C6 fungal-type domain-containing protein [Mycena kentingensis (nom. inval.)]